MRELGREVCMNAFTWAPLAYCFGMNLFIGLGVQYDFLNHG